MHVRRILFTLILLLSCRFAASQATATGTIVGVITDPTGAAIPGVTVTATEKNTNAHRTLKTNGSGEYRFDLLPAGDYVIHVEAQGFSSADTRTLSVQVGSSLTANIPLTTGSVSTTIEVSTGNGALLDAEKTDSSTNVTPQQVVDLPLVNRDFANLAILAPGVKLVDSYDPTKSRVAVYAVNGSSGRNNNTTVNGVDDKDNTVGGMVMQLPLEAVQEFKISSARFSAENGRSEGAAVNVITKSGTNQFHGSAYSFFRNDAFQAIDYFTQSAGQPKLAYSRQQYGGSFGGRIIRDHDFGFFAYEGLRERQSLSVDPNSYAELVLAAPLGAVAVHSIPLPYDDKRYNGRIDHAFNDKERLYFSYAAQDNKGLNDQDGGQADGTETNFTINDLIISNLTLNSVLSDKIVNSFTVGFQYWNNLIDTSVKKPYFTFPDGTNFGTNINVPQKSSQHKFQFRDDFSYALGKHTLKAGFDFLYEPQVGGYFENNPTPEFDFFDTAANLLNPAKYPNGFSSPGVVQASTGTSGDPSFNLSPKMLGLYVQDDWRVTKRLLLNIGLRYDKDIDTYGLAKQANSRTFQELVAAYATNKVILPTTRSNEAGVGYTPSLGYLGGDYSKLPSNDTLDISPRVGFSFDVFGDNRFVVRGGYGFYYGQTFENIPLFMIQQSNATVFANTYSISCNGPGDPSCTSVMPGTNILLSNWRYGVDPGPVIPPASYNLAPGSTGRMMDPSFRNPLTQQVNLGFQYQVTKSSVVEAEYAQARGLHEDKTININPTQYFAGGARPLSAAFSAAGVPVLGRFGLEAAIGRSYYDALNLSYRAIMGTKVNAIVNYTWSKALAFEGNPAAFRNTATNPFLGQFRDQDYGRAPNDETHHLTAAATFRLPFGIEASPILQLGSARPVDLVESTSDLWSVGSGRSNPHAVVDVSTPFTVANAVNFYNTLVARGKANKTSTAIEYRACLANGSCYETHYNSGRGQVFAVLDARVAKNIRLKDRYNINVFFQAFNLTNRANFGNNYQGSISTLAGKGLTAPYAVGYVNPTSTTLPRSFTGEFGARFSF